MGKYGKDTWAVQFPEGTVEDINRMMKVERRWMNVQEFIRDAVNEKIERWKKEHPPKG
jgi:UTP:GlnB (protein PII) uridylyltransferase